MISGLQTSSTLQECKEIKIESQSVSNDITQPMEHALFLILIKPTPTLPSAPDLQECNKTKIEPHKLSPIHNPAYEAWSLPNPNKT